MIELPCPICGARSVDEFRSLGDRPGSDGELTERWWHALGCRRVCLVARQPEGVLGSRPEAPAPTEGEPEPPKKKAGWWQRRLGLG